MNGDKRVTGSISGSEVPTVFHVSIHSLCLYLLQLLQYLLRYLQGPCSCLRFEAEVPLTQRDCLKGSRCQNSFIFTFTFSLSLCRSHFSHTHSFCHISPFLFFHDHTNTLSSGHLDNILSFYRLQIADDGIKELVHIRHAHIPNPTPLNMQLRTVPFQLPLQPRYSSTRQELLPILLE